MKKMKRIVVLCLVVVLCMSLATPAMAVSQAEAEAYVRQLYLGLLEREPDDAGKVAHVNMILNNNSKCGAVAEAIAGSAEFRNRTLSNEEYVRALYLGLFGREPDAGGLDTYVGALKSGYSRNWVLTQMLSSLEFTKVCLGYGMQVGTVSAPDKAPSVNQTNVNSGVAADYVGRLYKYLLEREMDSSAQGWVDKLTKREMSAAGVAAGIAASAEFNSKSYSNGEFVQKAYLALLGRNVDSAGWTNFMTHLNNGKSRSWVFSNICASAEFQSQFGEMNVAAGSVSSGNYNITGNRVDREKSAAFVERAYSNLLKRPAAEEEVDYWVEVLVDREMSAAGVAANIASSAEGRRLDRTREGFVTDVYFALLGREPDADGLKSFKKALANGYSRSWVFTKICASPEFQSRQEFAEMNVVPGYLNSADYNMG